jgi:hypothetical protein
MNALEFNRLYETGSRFKYRSKAHGEKLVKTVGAAHDTKNGVVVEINVIPYFADASRLIPVN